MLTVASSYLPLATVSQWSDGRGTLHLIRKEHQRQMALLQRQCLQGTLPSVTCWVGE